MARYMACHHNHFSDNRTQPAASYLMPWGSSPTANGFLPDHPENVICQYCKLQHQLIGFKFAGWQPFQIHICFYFTVELLTLPVGMVKVNDLRVCHPKVCPPGIYLDVIRE